MIGDGVPIDQPIECSGCGENPTVRYRGIDGVYIVCSCPHSIEITGAVSDSSLFEPMTGSGHSMTDRHTSYTPSPTTYEEQPPEEGPAERLEDLAGTFERKNEEYGESWRLAGELVSQILAEQDVNQLETDPQTMISLGLYFQRLHKITRGMTGEFALEELAHESVADSHDDEAVYATIHAHHTEVNDGTGRSDVD